MKQGLLDRRDAASLEIGRTEHVQRVVGSVSASCTGCPFGLVP
jgi:hypothetical protein